MIDVKVYHILALLWALPITNVIYCKVQGQDWVPSSIGLAMIAGMATWSFLWA